jgi:tRNA threonylcarbamoyl adenosine modification protein YeaZ
MTPHPSPSPARGEGKSRSRYLAIETSSPRLSLAIGDAERILADFTGGQDWRHAESLFDGIRNLLRRARWPIQSLTGVAVSIGPGSFTGIRIGLAAARALGQSLRIPVIGISSLEIMAAGAGTQAQWLAPQIDALRGQVFCGLFQRNGSGVLRRVLPESMALLEEWTKRVQARTRGQSLWISPLRCYPEARVLLDLARPRLAKGVPASYQSVLPLYIRKAAAQERKR